MSETTAPQARPVDGRTFPTKARGARPTFFDDAGATDAVIDIVTALAAEVWVLRERIDRLEGVDPGTSSQDAAAFTSRVFRVFEEMREEVVAGESEDRYRALVDRAFAEIGDKR
ncbi:MAG: hypothetical protein ACR2QO_15970 [Acidimicrobiales bacterium]